MFANIVALFINPNGKLRAYDSKDIRDNHRDYYYVKILSRRVYNNLASIVSACSHGKFY